MDLTESMKKGEQSPLMGKPKKRTSARKTGLRRSHIVLNLAKRVNAKSPIKARTTAKQSGKKATSK